MRPNMISISQHHAMCQHISMHISQLLQFIQVVICTFMQVSILILANFVVLYSQKG